ncbi:MAG: RnfABCDGE type electron transport complex subunit D [Lysobacterales bacterium]
MKDWLSTLATFPARFFWSSKSVTRSAPHIRDTNSVQRLWNYFVIASLPTWLIGLWSLGHQTNMALADFQIEKVSGWRGWLLTQSGIGFEADSIFACFTHGLLYFIPVIAVALAVGAFWEALFAKVRKKTVDEGLLAIAWLFALMLPATVPMYQVALGMTFGIVIGKLIYGGSGRYLLSPALLGLAFLVFSYPALLYGEGAWVPVAGYDQPTVLALITDEGGLGVVNAVDYSYWQLFLGDKPGAFGVVSPLGAMLGAVFLIVTGVASWRIILGIAIGLIAVAMTSNAVAPDHHLFSVPWYWHLVLGGFVFGAVFIATDPVAGPLTNPGRWGFGMLVGSLAMVIRLFNPSYYEGVMFAILLASIFSPLIDFVVIELNIRRRRMRLLERSP